MVKEMLGGSDKVLYKWIAVEIQCPGVALFRWCNGDRSISGHLFGGLSCGV